MVATVEQYDLPEEEVEGGVLVATDPYTRVFRPAGDGVFDVDESVTVSDEEAAATLEAEDEDE